MVILVVEYIWRHITLLSPAVVAVGRVHLAPHNSIISSCSCSRRVHLAPHNSIISSCSCSRRVHLAPHNSIISSCSCSRRVHLAPHNSNISSCSCSRRVHLAQHNSIISSCSCSRRVHLAPHNSIISSCSCSRRYIWLYLTSFRACVKLSMLIKITTNINLIFVIYVYKIDLEHISKFNCNTSNVYLFIFWTPPNRKVIINDVYSIYLTNNKAREKSVMLIHANTQSLIREHSL